MTRRAAALALLAAVACSTRSGDPSRVPPGTGPVVGVYRATFGTSGAASRHAKIVLWAARPDRLHAELLAPVGGVRLLVDAGGGAASVVDPVAGTAYVGAAGPEDVARIVGVRVAIADLVEALLSGTGLDGLRVSREGPDGPALPGRFSIADGDRSITLALVKLQRSAASADRLGTGTPPPAMRVRPLGDLPAGETALDAASNAR